MFSSRVPLGVRLLKACALLLTALYLVHVLTAGTDEITRPLDKFDAPSYGERVAQRHGCVTTTGQLPTAAVVTFRDEVVARYTTDPREVDLAFRAALGEDVPSVYSVTDLCQ